MTTQHWNSGLLIVRLSNVAEVFRCSEVTMLVCEMVAFGVRAEPKIFEAAYGDPSGQKYWEANLSEPITSLHLAHVLSVHLAERTATDGEGNGCGHSGFSQHVPRPAAAEATAHPNHVVEQALAHTIGNAVEAAYRRGDLFEKRRHLMNDWAQFCGRPSAGADAARHAEAKT